MSDTSASPPPATAPTSWYQSAADATRQRLFGPGIVAAFALGMLLVLALAVPQKRLHETLAGAPRTDTLTIAYLRAWLAADPGDAKLHLTLARKTMLLGRYSEALAAIVDAERTGDDVVRAQAWWLRLEVLERIAWDAPPDSPERIEGLARVRAELARIAESTSRRDELRMLMRRALALDDVSLANRLARRIAAAPPEPALPGAAATGAVPASGAGGGAAAGDASADVTPEALARTAISLGDFALAAQIGWQAFDETTDASRRRALVSAIAGWEQSGNRLREFFAALEPRLERVAPDRALWLRLTRLALAAERLDLAERFARAMVRYGAVPMPSGQTVASVLRGLLESAIPSAQAGEREWSTQTTRESSSLRPAPQGPFDDETWRLAYDVFLARGRPDDAWRVAAAAVRDGPERLEWRRRLAQVSEWTQRPTVALAQWQAIARRTDEAQAWRNVERLAAGLSDHEATLEVLRREAARGGDVPGDLRVAATLELLGRPAEAIDWLARRARERPAAEAAPLWAALADLAERRGDGALALQTLQETTRRYGPDVARAARMAALLYDRGRVREAFEALQQARGDARSPAHDARAERATGFWGSYAELARLLQREDDALEGFARLAALDAAGRSDLERWGSLLEPRSLRAAALVAEFQWRRERAPASLERAVTLRLQAGDGVLAEQLLREAPPEQRARLEADPDVLRLRAAWHQRRGDLARARADLERALAAGPEDVTLRAQRLWLLIAQRDAPALREALQSGHRIALAEPELWAAHGAGWLALGEARWALPWFQRVPPAGRDTLWWLTYADALAEAGQIDTAWQVRRLAWLDLRAGRDGPGTPGGRPGERREVSPAADERARRDEERRERVVALALQFAPGDRAAALLRTLVSDRLRLPALIDEALRDPTARAAGPLASPAEAPPADGASLAAAVERALARTPRVDGEDAALRDAGLDARALRGAASELAVAALLDAGRSEAAQAWMLSRYARDLSQPAWAQLSIALAEDDRRELGRLLDTIADWLPRLDRIEALARTGRLASAQTRAADGLEARPDDDAMHQRAFDLLPQSAARLALTALDARIGTLGVQGRRVDGGWRIDDRRMLTLLADTSSFSSRSDDGLSGLPARETLVAVGLRTRVDDGWWAVGLGRRQGLAEASFASLQAALERRGASFGLTAGLGLPAIETPALRAAGRRDRLELRATLPVATREYLTATVFAGRYSTLAGTEVGTGWGGTLEAGSRLRLAYPDLVVRVQASTAQYRPGAADDALIARLTPLASRAPIGSWLPTSASQAAVAVTVGDSAAWLPPAPGLPAERAVVTRAWRPWAEVGLRANSVTGGGYNARVGMATSVFGGDRLTLHASLASAAPGSGGAVRELALSYQWHF